MRTHIFTQAELSAINAATGEIAYCQQDHAGRLKENPLLPIQPIAVRKLDNEIAGAEGITVVADYEGDPSVGYVTLAELERDHEFTDDVVLNFARIQR